MLLFRIRIAQKRTTRKRNRAQKQRERESSNSLPQQCSDVFWLHTRRERGRRRRRMSLSLFFSCFPLPFSRCFYSFLRSIKRFGSMAVFFSFFSSVCVVFSSFELGSGGSYRRHIHTLMTISGSRRAREACLTYAKLRAHWRRRAM